MYCCDAFVLRDCWMPCPLCGRMYGGHEARDIDGKPSSIPEPNGLFGAGLLICPAFARAGLGSEGVGMATKQ